MKPTTPKLDEALKLAEDRHWAVFPLHGVTDGRCDCGHQECKSPGKHPIAKLVPNGFKNATTDMDQIREWWQKKPNANIGVATGQSSNGLIVVDVDSLEGHGKDGMQSWREFTRTHEGNFDSASVKTGSGGRHYYYAAPPGETIRSATDKIGPGVDVKSDGGYVVAPCSDHQSGETYEWLVESEIAIAPSSLIEACKSERAKLDITASLPCSAGELARVTDAIGSIPADDRELWFQVGASLKSTGWTEARAIWDDWSQNSAKYDVEEQEKTWSSLHPEGGITLGTLFHLAETNGWREKFPQCSEWEVPEPLEDSAQQVMPFDPEMLPNSLREWVESEAHVMQAPIDYIAVSAMVSLSSLIARDSVIRPKKYADWEVVPNIWGLLIGPPSAKKSPALKSGTNPLNTIQLEKLDNHIKKEEV